MFFLSLVRLRYQLLWAQSRTSSGRVTLFFTLYIFGILIFLFSSLGGFSAAILGVKIGHAETITRWILSSVFLGGILASLVLGVGPQAAFSETVLRRYPLTSTVRLIVRHLIGLLDPTWILLIAVVLGLAIGLATLGIGSFFIGLPTVLLFIIVTYLTSMVLLTLINRMLQYRSGTTILSGIVLGLFAISAMVGPFVFHSNNPVWAQSLDRALQFLPPGIVAALLTVPTFMTGLFGVLMLIVWCAISANTLRALERRPVVRVVVVDKISWENPYDWLANLFGPTYAPLVGKFLRYYLRCNRVRYSLIVTTVIMAFFGGLYGQHNGPQGTLGLTIGFFFYAGLTSTATMTLNQFGYDDGGIRRYSCLPINFIIVLRTASFASLLVGGLVILPALTLWIFFSGVSFEWPMLPILVGSSITGFFFFNTIGLWITILSPKKIQFHSIMDRNQLSGLGMLVMFIGAGLMMILIAILTNNISLSVILNYWLITILPVVFSILLYIVSWRFITPQVKARREHIIKAIASANAN